jgi:hypothetical protein
MTRILTPLRLEYIDNRWKYLLDIFIAESDVLRKYGLKSRIEIPPMFVNDGESIPLFRGSDREGLIHDFISRIEAVIGITKGIGAEVYREFLSYCDRIDTERFESCNHPWIPDPIITPVVKTKDWGKRWSKWFVVRVWPGYWQRFSVLASPEEIMGLKKDPYVTTEEKIDNLIYKTKEISVDIKDLPPESQGEMVKKVADVTTELKKEKEEL